MITRLMRGLLGKVIEGLFYQFVEKLYEMGEVKFKNLFADGTKIEAYPNNTSVTLEECYEVLILQAQWINLTLVKVTGKRKTQLHRDIETLKEYIDKKNEYYACLGKFDNRNSFSKTDTDTTFMHMKEDYMRNGQLKPG